MHNLRKLSRGNRPFSVSRSRPCTAGYRAEAPLGIGRLGKPYRQINSENVGPRLSAFGAFPEQLFLPPASTAGMLPWIAACCSALFLERALPVSASGLSSRCHQTTRAKIQAATRKGERWHKKRWVLLMEGFKPSGLVLTPRYNDPEPGTWIGAHRPQPQYQRFLNAGQTNQGSVQHGLRRPRSGSIGYRSDAGDPRSFMETVAVQHPRPLRQTISWPHGTRRSDGRLSAKDQCLY